MSYAAAAALQAAIFLRLQSQVAGVDVFDAVPPTATGTFILIGPEEARDLSDKTGAGAEHLPVISVITDAAGFQAAKAIAASISDALIDTAMTLTRGRLVSMQFVRASARRIDEGDIRRIDLTFRARVEV